MKELDQLKMLSESILQIEEGTSNKDDEAFWLAVSDTIATYPAINSADLQDFEFHGDTYTGQRYILFYLEIEGVDSTVQLIINHAWGDRGDGTYGKPSQSWELATYPDHDEIDSSLYRVEVAQTPQDEARKIINNIKIFFRSLA